MINPIKTGVYHRTLVVTKARDRKNLVLPHPFG